jgi:hypothetical protein
MAKYFLILFFAAARLAAENHLTLYFIPSPLGIDWSSPSKLTWSALRNKLTFKPHFMGHVFVEFQWGKNREVTGMTPTASDYFPQLLIHGRGLGILYHCFGGRLEKKEHVDAELAGYFKKGGITFTRFLLNDAQCRRISEYLRVYREQNHARNYGLSNRPRYGEGAGCSAFGVSFVDVAGLLEPELIRAWSHSVAIPMIYLGPPLREKGVSLLGMMLHPRSWAAENEPHKTLTFWDPDRMVRWANGKIEGAGGRCKVLQAGKVKGVVLDRRHVPAPRGPIWLHRSGISNGLGKVRAGG